MLCFYGTCSPHFDDVMILYLRASSFHVRSQVIAYGVGERHIEQRWTHQVRVNALGEVDSVGRGSMRSLP